MIARLGICCGVIAAGLSLRILGFNLGIPAFVVKYGGSMLWAVMLYFLVAMIYRSRSRMRIALLTMLVAVLVESFRLYHTPWLDAFRLTLPGALLLGRIFSPWNIVAYAAGTLVAMLADPARESVGQKSK